MPERKPERQTVSVAEAGRRFAPLLDRVAGRETRMIVERDGVAVAAIVPIADLRTIDRLEAERDAEFAVLERIGAAFRTVPDEEIEREVDRAVADVRAENRDRTQREAADAR